MTAGGIDRLAVQPPFNTLSTQTAEQISKLALDNVGGFLDESEPHPDFVLWQAARTMPVSSIEDIPEEHLVTCARMAKDLPLVPIDEFSGLAYPIIIPPDELGGESDHHIEFPADHPLLRCRSGQPLRASFVEHLPFRLHNQGPEAFHNRFSVPESLPSTLDEQTGAMVLADAGYLPRMGIDLASDSCEVRTLTDMEWNRWRMPGTWSRSSISQKKIDLATRHSKWLINHPDRPVKVPFGPGELQISNRIVETIRKTEGMESEIMDFHATESVEKGVQLITEAARLLAANTVFRGDSLATKYAYALREGQLMADVPEDCAKYIVMRLGHRVCLQRTLKRVWKLGFAMREQAA